MEIKVSAVDISRLGNAIAPAGNKAPHAFRRALNHTGGKARTQIVRVLRDQTGAKYGGAVRKALTTKRANYGALKYEIIAKGGHISLKEFAMRPVTIR
jgi:hypothetical protein